MLPRRPRPQLIQGSIIRLSTPRVSGEWVVTHIPDGRFLTTSEHKGVHSRKEPTKKIKLEEQKRPKLAPLSLSSPRVVAQSTPTSLSPLRSPASRPTVAPSPLMEQTSKPPLTSFVGKKRGRPKVHLQARHVLPPHEHSSTNLAKILESGFAPHITDVEIELDYLEAYRYYIPKPEPEQEYVDSDATASDSEGCKKRKLDESAACESEDEQSNDVKDAEIVAKEFQQPIQSFVKEEDTRFGDNQSFESFNSMVGSHDNAQIQVAGQQQQNITGSVFQEQYSNYPTNPEFQMNQYAAPNSIAPSCYALGSSSGENDDKQTLQEQAFTPNPQMDYGGYPQYAGYAGYSDFTQNYNFDPARYSAAQAAYAPNFMPFPFQNGMGQ